MASKAKDVLRMKSREDLRIIYAPPAALTAVAAHQFLKFSPKFKTEADYEMWKKDLELELSIFQKQNSRTSMNSWSYSKIFKGAMDRYLNQKGYSNALAQLFRNDYYTQETSDELFVSYALIDGFLRSNKEVFGDYLSSADAEKALDDVLYLNFDTSGVHSSLVINHLTQGKSNYAKNKYALLAFYHGMSLNHRDVVRSLSRKEVLTILAEAGTYNKTGIPTALQGLVMRERDTTTQGVPRHVVTNHFMQILSSVILNERKESTMNIPRIISLAAESLRELNMYCARDEVELSPARVLTKDLEALAVGFEKITGLIRVDEIAYIIYSLREPVAVSRSGSRAGLTKLYSSILESKDVESAAQIIKIFAAVRDYEFELPTIKEWQKAFDAGELDDWFMMEITVGGIHTTSRSRRINRSVEEFKLSSQAVQAY